MKCCFNDCLDLRQYSFNSLTEDWNDKILFTTEKMRKTPTLFLYGDIIGANREYKL
jgi:hypothetical protein